MRAARIGGPIALIVVGLILALAIAETINGIDVTMIGWILTGAGALWLVLEVALNRPRPTTTREVQTPTRRDVYRNDI